MQKTKPEESLIVRTEEAAALFGLRSGRIRQWLCRGLLEPVAYDGRFPLIRASDVYRLLKCQNQKD